MKLRIVTFHRAYNYGAVLQCYALSEALRNNGAECEVLDYWPQVFYNTYYMPVKFKILRPPVRSFIRKMKIYPVLHKRNVRFENFIKENIPKTKQMYTTVSDIEKVKSDVDAYITGSDQVWHNKWANFDPIFFLDFPDANTKKKYSYAASFGMTEIPAELKEEYKRRLSCYEKISVREKSGTDIIKNLLGNESECSCDPTLLLTAEQWKVLAGTPQKKEPYILVYYTSCSKLLQDRAEALSKRTGYKVICLPCTMDSYVLSGKFDNARGFEVVADFGPYEFLSLMINAEYVLTNTFHGTVFSIIFKKRFMTQMVSESGLENTRVKELFEELGISGRSLNSDFNRIDENIDWSIVEERLHPLRERSLNYLKNIISDN